MIMMVMMVVVVAMMVIANIYQVLIMGQVLSTHNNLLNPLKNLVNSTLLMRKLRQRVTKFFSKATQIMRSR